MSILTVVWFVFVPGNCLHYFHVHCVNHFKPRQWVWELSSSKLEGMCEWLYECMWILCVKQYPQALQWSYWFTALSSCTPRNRNTRSAATFFHGEACDDSKTLEPVRGESYHSQRQIGHPNKTPQTRGPKKWETICIPMWSWRFSKQKESQIEAYYVEIHSILLVKIEFPKSLHWVSFPLLK